MSGAGKRVTAADLARLTPQQRALLERLARQKDRARRGPQSFEEPIPRRGPGDRWPLSLDQERLWLLHQVEPESPAWNITHPMWLRQPLDFRLMQRTLEEVMRRHEVWRSIFPAEDGRPVQVVLPPAPVPLRVVDLRAQWSREENRRRMERQVLALVRAEAQMPFDLAAGPLVRTAVLWLAEDEMVYLISLHHIVTDWISMRTFWDEFRAIYQAFSEGRPSPLPMPPVQYADFAVWQRRQMESGGFDEHLRFWREHLADAPMILELPTDHPRPRVQRQRGQRRYMRLDRRLSERVRELSRSSNASAFMTLTTAFKALLLRITGQQRLIVGTPSANRDKVEIETILGFFLNQLVLYTDLRSDPSFRQALERVRRVCLDAYAHQVVPFFQLLEELKPVRDPSRAPMVQATFFVLELEEEQLGGEQSRVLDLDKRTARTDLGFFLWDFPGGFQGWMVYNTDLFDPSTVQRLTEQFTVLLEAAVVEPETRLSALPLLTAGQRHQLTVEWSRGEAVADSDLSVAQLFLRLAASRSQAEALRHLRRGYTYGWLAERSAALAAVLRQRGVGAGDRVAVCLPRSPALFAAALAVFRRGAVYVPLDPSHPVHRRSAALADAGVGVLVAERGDALAAPSNQPGGRLPELSVVAVEEALAEPPPAGAATVDAGELEPGQPESLAFVIYTSGSTGRPKGVAGTQRQLLNRLRWMWRAAPFAAGEVVCQKTPLSFVDSLGELLGGLLQGVPTVILGDEEGRDPQLLVTRLAEERVTRLWLVPSLMRSMLELYPHLGTRLPDLKRWVSSGEALPAELAERFRRAVPGARLVNVYGSSEAWDSTVYTLHGAYPESWRVPIGRPLDGVEVHVLDDRMVPVPPGVHGHLHVAGAHLARGYLDQPAATAEKFRPHPRGTGWEGPGARLYATGDVVRWLADGRLEYWQRSDQQIKIRGSRVEPAEIEAVLASHPAVARGVVVARYGGGTDPRLAAYAVLREGAGGEDSEEASAPEDLRWFLQSRLPEYMVPATVTLLDELPLNASGKVDRGALPEPVVSSAETVEEPTNAVEKILARIWAEVLGVPRVGLRDNFFALGGDSILNVQIVSRAQRQGLRITPRQLFEAPTVAELAALAAEGATEAEQDAVVGAVPLTPVQHHFFHRYTEDPHHFTLPEVLTVPAELAPRALERALAMLVQHHDSLRLSFHHGEDGWSQRSMSPAEAPLPLPVVDLSRLPEEARRTALSATATGLQERLELASAPLVRAVLFLEPPDAAGALARPRLFLTAHHLVLDGVSRFVLLQDLERLCGQLLERPEAVEAELLLPLKTTSFRRWAETLEEAAADPRVRAEEALWLRPASAPPVVLPVDSVEGEDLLSTLESVEQRFDAGITRALLHQVRDAYRLRTEETLLTALVLAVDHWLATRDAGTAQPDGRRLMVQVEGHGGGAVTEHLDLSRTVGWFSHLYPLLVDLEGVEDPGACLVAVKEQWRAVPDGGIGFGLLRYQSPDAELRRQLAALPPPEVSFSYQGLEDAVEDTPDALLQSAAQNPGERHSRRHRLGFKLALEMRIAGDQLVVRWDYSHRRYHRRTVEQLAELFRRELTALVDHCRSEEAGGVSVSDFPLLEQDADLLDAALEEADVEDF